MRQHQHPFAWLALLAAGLCAAHSTSMAQAAEQSLGAAKPASILDKTQAVAEPAQVTLPSYPVPAELPVNRELSYQAALKKADSGDPAAQTQVGLMRLEGDGVPVDLKLARIWWGKAAVQNHAPAQFYLGQLLMLDVLGATGPDLNKQLTEGLGWLRRASREQYRPAQLLYAQTLLDSQNDSPFGHSKIEAESMLLQCASDYRPCTYYALGRLDREITKQPGICPGDERCETRHRLLYALAQTGDTQAMIRLSNQPGEDTMYWVRRAARLGNAKACLQLATMALSGQAPLQPEDPSILALLNTSAQAGETEAMLLLGRLLYEGKRFPVNRALAIQWLERASARGNTQASDLLAKALNRQKATPVPQDLSTLPIQNQEQAIDTSDVVELPVQSDTTGEATPVSQP